MGILVMDESFDMWRRKKSNGDYARFFDEDEMEKFLTQNVSQCHYFQLYDEYKIVRKQN